MAFLSDKNQHTKYRCSSKALKAQVIESKRWESEVQDLLPGGSGLLRGVSLTAPVFLLLTYGVCMTNTARHASQSELGQTA